MEFDLGLLNLIRATYICQSLARMGHQLSKLNGIPDYLYMCRWMLYWKILYHLAKFSTVDPLN